MTKNANTISEINQQDFSVIFSDTALFYENCQNIFQKYGIISIKNLITPDIQDKIFNTALYFYKQTANKINIATPNTNDLTELDFYVTNLEKVDRQASVQAQKLISQSSGILSLTLNNNLMKINSLLLGIDKELLLLEGFGGFVPNIPENVSRLYTYHSEAHWIPLRKKFINCWAPLFRQKQHKTGTMFVKPYSHKKIHEFYEYQGFGENGDKDSYTQYETPDSSEFSEVPLLSQPGDIVLFDRNLLHRSEVNEAANVSYLFVNRFFDISKDLTISANLNIRPYSAEANKLGRRIFGI